ncbi:unnamed protein product [Oreochromis niloticus]|nr:unnamed protein product [Mustela putorius furo]
MLTFYQMPRKNKRSQAQKKRWKPLDLVDPAVPMLTGHNQDEAVSSFPSVQQTAPARLSLETQDRPTSLCSPGIKQTAPASLSLETENRPTSLCPPGSKISDTRPPAKRVWATDDFHTASNSPPKKLFHNINEQLLTEELQRNTVQHFWCVSATHCQSDERYTEFSRNHQCTCNALTFLAYLNEEHQFNTARLDKVLEQGDALYCWIKTNLQQERRYTQDHLTMEDLPKEVHADINVYSVKMDNIRYGYLKAADKTYQRKEWWLPLASRLVCLSTDVNYALLMVSPQCIAVFRDKSGRYGLFDSHSRSAAGLPQPNGTAVMLTFTHVNDLINHLHNLFQNQGRYARYEFVPVSFKRVSTHNEQPAQSTRATGATATSSPQNDEPQITNSTVQVPQPESAQTYMTMLENTSKSSQDKMASCEHQLETSVDPTSNIRKEQESIELNNERETARNVCKLNKRRRRKANRQAPKNQRQSEVAKKTNKKRNEKERYATCHEFRMKKLQTLKTQYAVNCHYHKQKLLSNKNYYANPQIQGVIKAHKVKKYQSDPHFQQKKRNYIIRRYSTDPDFQTRQKKYVVQKYNRDASFKTKQKQYLVQRYNTDADFRSRQKKYMRQKYREEDVRERKRAHIRTIYASDPNYRHKQKKSIHARYHNDSQFRLHHIQRCAQYQRHKMATTASFAIYKKLCAQRIKKKYSRLVTQFQQGPQSEAQPQLVVNSVMQAATLAFRETIQLGPTHVCTVCHRTLFPNQVKHCKRSKYVKNSHIVDTCLTGKFVHVCDSECTANCTIPKQRMQEWICYNCDSHLQRGKISSIAVANNLALAPIPIELSQLNVLE